MAYNERFDFQWINDHNTRVENTLRERQQVIQLNGKIYHRTEIARRSYTFATSFMDSNFNSSELATVVEGETIAVYRQPKALVASNHNVLMFTAQHFAFSPDYSYGRDGLVVRTVLFAYIDEKLKQEFDELDVLNKLEE